MSTRQNKLDVGLSRNDWKKPSRRPRHTKPVHSAMSEQLKIDIDSKIHSFLESDESSLTMPPSITKDQRAYIHRYAMKLGLVSRSRGKNENRVLTLFKSVRTTLMGDNLESVLPAESVNLILDLMDKQDNLKISNNILAGSERLLNPPANVMVNRLTKRFIPPLATASTWMSKERQALPICAMRHEILDTISSQQVIIVNGETGSGKSTQLPQYILEDANARQVPCRIICTQPRRIAAMSIAERVAFERSEKLGTTVGYQIRLENKFQYETNLIFATSGCFLRSLMTNSRQTFQGISHIVIDEIHERDKNTDFVLIALREEIKRNKELKIILMSATMNINLLCEYFSGCHVIQVPGTIYETRTFFLEDIIFYIKYQTAKMRLILESMPEITSTDQNVTAESVEAPAEQLDPETRVFVDDLIQACCDESQDVVAESLEQLVYLIEGEGVPINVRHTTSGCTPLMAAAARNHLEYVQLLLKKGAKIHISNNKGKTALDYAKQHPTNPSCLDYLRSVPRTDLAAAGVVADERRKLLLAYQQQFDNEYDEIDHDLLLSLLLTINKADFQGSILVFLPGYNDMMLQKEMIEREFKRDNYKLFLIHGSMSTNDQRMAFQQTNVRKIILATNIAETSITFPDVAYVIDTGRVKQHVYNSMTGSSYLQSVDISKACAKQRAGRAGRTQTGICYRLYSSAKFASMREYAVPEFLRVPLTEICLYTKVISQHFRIANYLAKAIEPPSIPNVTNAIHKLRLIGALDENENLTILGKRLVDIPLDVQFGKCLLYAVLLGCVNPVVTIVAYYSAKDPFLLSADRMDRGRVNSIRKELCENSISDHLGIIRLYQKWKKSHQLRTEARFLADYNLSKQSLNMMSAVQSQIFDHVKRIFLQPGAPLNTLNANSNDWNIIRACLTAGLYPNIARINRQEGKIKTQFEKSAAFHTSSVLSDSKNRNDRKSFENLPTNWVVFSENSRVGSRAFIRYNTMVTPLDVALFCGGLKHEMDDVDTVSEDAQSADEGDNENANEEVAAVANESKTLAVDEWIRFNIPTNEFYVLTQFKMLLLDAFVNLLHLGPRWHCGKYSYLISTLKKVLSIDSREHFGITSQPFDDSYLPKRYDTLTNIKRFRIEKKPH